MPILTNNDWLASQRERLAWNKTVARTTVANRWYTMFDLAGNPGAGVLAGGETTPPANTVGRVPTDAIPGYPRITDFASGAVGYIDRVVGHNTIAGTAVRVCDRLYVAGSYVFNASVAVVSPSWASRVPTLNAAPSYHGLEIWVEQVTAATGNQTVNVTYTNQDNVTGRTTGAVGINAAPTVGSCWQLPLQAGDTGVRAISNVVGAVATAGTFNVMVLRPLVAYYVQAVNEFRTYTYIDTGMPVVFQDSALWCQILTNAGTTSGLPWAEIGVASKA